MINRRNDGDGFAWEPSPGHCEWRSALEVVLRRSIRRGGFAMPDSGLSAILSEWIGRYAEHPSVTQSVLLRIVVRRLISHHEGA